MTRQEKLSAISMKMARTWWGTWVGETGYYLPVMIGDVLQWQYKTPWIKSWPDTRSEIVESWGDWTRQIDLQDDDTIDYIYSLIS